VYDVVIIGGGHNGLVIANYLAREGLKVGLFERREIVGGASVTEELWPGVRVCTGAYVLSLLKERIIRDLRLRDFGLRIHTKDPALFVPFGRGRNLYLWNDVERSKREIAKFSAKDAEAYPKWVKFWEDFAELVDLFFLSPPPSLNEAEDLMKLAKGLDETTATEILRVFFRDARSMLDEYFESEEVKAALVEDAVVGVDASPSTPGTAYVLAHHVIGEVNGIKGAWGYVEGGMGEVTQAMKRSALSAGVEIWEKAEVEEITVSHNRVTGVKLVNGKEVKTKAVVSNADPKTTFLRLLRNAELDSSLVRRVSKIATKGVSFKVVGYLTQLPDFGNGSSLRPEHIASELIIPSVDYVERAFRDSKDLGYSKEPWLSINIQSSVDPTVAPPGHFSFSIFGQYLPYSKNLDELKDQIYEEVLSKVRDFAPNFSPVKYEVLTPLDLERRFGMWEGNIFHVDMRPDQLFLFRPLPELSRYSTPIEGLFLCGAGTHPGGGVTGAPGYNAAGRVIGWFKTGR
jgi:phytoene dehydrogenase-like protein